MATHSSVLAWKIPGMGEPGGLPSMGSHRIGHDWRDLAAAASYKGILYIVGIQPIFYYTYKWSIIFKNCESLLLYTCNLYNVHQYISIKNKQPHFQRKYENTTSIWNSHIQTQIKVWLKQKSGAWASQSFPSSALNFLTTRLAPDWLETAISRTNRKET